MPFEFAKDVAVSFERDNGNVHRAAANIIVSKKPRGPRLRVQRIVITHHVAISCRLAKGTKPQSW